MNLIIRLSHLTFRNDINQIFNFYNLKNKFIIVQFYCGCKIKIENQLKTNLWKTKSIRSPNSGDRSRHNVKWEIST